MPACFSTAAFPDTLKVRLQTQSHLNPTYSGLGDCVRKTWSAEGAAGFYKGVSSPLVGQMFFNAVQFLAYGFAKELVVGRPLTPLDHLTVPQYFAAGALTGFTVAFVECPIDLFKTQLQTQVFQAKPQFTTFLGTVSHIARNHGIRGCFQGLPATIARNVPAVSTYFGVYEASRGWLRSEGQRLEDLESWKLLTAGSLGGLGYWLACYPIDCVKSAIQADAIVPSERRFKGTLDCVKQLWAEGGVARFFKGVAPCALRAAPANAVCFFLYQKSVQWLN